MSQELQERICGCGSSLDVILLLNKESLPQMVRLDLSNCLQVSGTTAKVGGSGVSACLVGWLVCLCVFHFLKGETSCHTFPSLSDTSLVFLLSPGLLLSQYKSFLVLQCLTAWNLYKPSGRGDWVLDRVILLQPMLQRSLTTILHSFQKHYLQRNTSKACVKKNIGIIQLLSVSFFNLSDLIKSVDSVWLESECTSVWSLAIPNAIWRLLNCALQLHIRRLNERQNKILRSTDLNVFL